MKIITKFKDFYDYKVAKYGVDEKLIYTRKTYCEYFESFVIDVYTASDDIILNAPIFLIEYIGEYNDGMSRRQYFPPLYKFTYNPNLSQMGVYIDEDFIWQSLVEFLSNKRSEKEISPEVSNENKILSKGFDLKTSFRPNMKKKHKGDIWR